MSTLQGRIAEQEFQLLCMKRNIPIYAPIIDNHGVDFIVQSKTKLLRIQVKSVRKMDSKRNTYKVNVVRGFDCRTYAEGDFDLLVVYIFDVSCYYIIPQDLVTTKCIRLNPNGGRGKYAEFKERWDLLIK